MHTAPGIGGGGTVSTGELGLSQGLGRPIPARCPSRLLKVPIDGEQGSKCVEKTPWGTPGGGGLGPSWWRLQTGAPPRGHASLWGWCRRPRVMAEAGRPGAGVPHSPWWLRTVRQPMQQFRRLAKAKRPPTLPVSTVLQRVWSPPAGEGWQWVGCQTGPPVPPPAPGGPPIRSNTASARPSPRMGSKIRRSGLASCCSR